jgi:hypothetical protein
MSPLDPAPPEELLRSSDPEFRLRRRQQLIWDHVESERRRGLEYTPPEGETGLYGGIADEGRELLAYLTQEADPEVIDLRDGHVVAEIEVAAEPALAEASPATHVRGDSGRFIRWLPVAAIALSLGLWVVSLSNIDVDAMGDTGLVSVFPISYYVGLAVLLVGVVVELSRARPRSRVLAALVAVLVAVVHATIPILYNTPRYAYVYKHIAVTRYVEAHGTVDRSIEIYQNWTGFPGVAAYLARITGIDPFEMANWALVFFAVIGVLAVRFAVRAFTTDVRVVALSSVVFILGGWVGQQYFAPQSLAFVMSVAAVGVVLRCLPSRRSARAETRVRARDDGSGSSGRLTRVRAFVASLDERYPVRPAPLTPRVAVVLTLAFTAVVVVTHPLSALLLIMWLAVLTVFGRLRLWWVPAIALVMVLVSIAAAHDWLAAHVNLLGDIGNTAKNTKGTGGPQPGSPGHELVVLAARLLSLAIFAMSGVGVVARFARGRRDLTAPLLAMVPLSMVLAQSYGGEMIYRVFLFALPWCSFLVASALVDRVRPSGDDTSNRPLGPVRSIAVGFLLAGMTALFLPAAFGLERFNHIPPEEVAASTWFEENAAPDSVLTTIAPNFPSEITADYAMFRTPWGTWGTAVIGEDPRFMNRELTAADVPAVINYLQWFGSGDVYVALGPSQSAYEDSFRDVPPGTVEHLGELLTAAPGVEVVYRSGDVTILKLPRPAARPN